MEIWHAGKRCNDMVTNTIDNSAMVADCGLSGQLRQLDQYWTLQLCIDKDLDGTGSISMTCVLNEM